MSYIGTSKVGGMYLGDTKIGKAYLGDDLVYQSAPPFVDPTLIAYWNGADAPVSGNWVDRIGSKRITPESSFTRGTGYYEFDNVADGFKYATFTDNDFNLDYEVRVVVDFAMKPNNSVSMVLFDFGGYGATPSGNWGFCPYRGYSSGSWFLIAKYNGNNTQTTTLTGTFPTMTNDVWNDCVLESGIELDKNTDEQRTYLIVGDAKLVTPWVKKIKINPFIASANKARLAMTCASQLKSRVRIKTFKVYNTTKPYSDEEEIPTVLPYDAEVEYLETTGTQWIDTGVTGNQNTRVRVKFMATSSSGYMYVYGCRGDNSHSITIGVGSSFNWRFGNQTQVKTTSVNTIYDVVQDKNKLRINGTETTYGTVSDFTTPDNIYLMWASLDTYSYHYQGRIYFMKILNGDTLVRDFIPVRVGQVGYMYDKVSGQLFGNDGTGSFTLGNDIT